jgi:hypothetical protein
MNIAKRDIIIITIHLGNYKVCWQMLFFIGIFFYVGQLHVLSMRLCTFDYS